LAEKVLKDTDWTIDTKSEVIVETISEPLVYLTINSVPSAQIYRITDQSETNAGVGETLQTNNNSWAGRTILAFYSSCTNKPQRF
jgi:hypothetical protein